MMESSILVTVDWTLVHFDLNIKSGVEDNLRLILVSLESFVREFQCYC